MNRSKFPGIFERRQKKGILLLTKNFAPGKTVYTESIIKDNNEEFRTWDIFKSKLAAAIVKGIRQIGIKPGDFVLYLGASTGTTPSHVSDIVGKEGFVFALDFAPRVVRDLVFVCEERKNMAPLLANANKPLSYMQFVSQVDIVYQDIAQRNQVDIFVKNVNLYLKDGGFGLLALKARSIDVTKKPSEIFDKVRKELSEKFQLIDQVKLAPFEKDHCMFIIKK